MKYMNEVSRLNCGETIPTMGFGTYSYENDREETKQAVKTALKVWIYILHALHITKHVYTMHVFGFALFNFSNKSKARSRSSVSVHFQVLVYCPKVCVFRKSRKCMAISVGLSSVCLFLYSMHADGVQAFWHSKNIWFRGSSGRGINRSNSWSEDWKRRHLCHFQTVG